MTTVYRGHSSALSHDDFHRFVTLLKHTASWESQSSSLDGCMIPSVWCCTENLQGTCRWTVLRSPNLL